MYKYKYIYIYIYIYQLQSQTLYLIRVIVDKYRKSENNLSVIKC